MKCLEQTQKTSAHMESDLSRRMFLQLSVAAWSMAGRMAIGGEASHAAASNAERDHLLDCAIRIIGNTGLESATKERIAQASGTHTAVFDQYFHSEADFLAAAAARIYERRQATFEAAIRDAKSNQVLDLFTAISNVTPDLDYVAYWDIAFAIRHDAELKARIQKATNDYDQGSEERYLAHFPKDTDARGVDFAMFHIDGLALTDMTLVRPVNRGPHLVLLTQLTQPAMKTSPSKS